MSDICTEFKQLRLNGMADAWSDMESQGDLTVKNSGWLLKHLLQAEHTDRAIRSIDYQLRLARFPIYRDLAGFDFEPSKVDKRLITDLSDLSDLSFTDQSHNLVLIGGT